MLGQYLHIFLFAILGFVLFAGMLGVLMPLIRDRGTAKIDKSAYECGMPAEGSPWMSPNIRFYSFCLLFVIFDVEALFIFPWAVQFRELGMQGLLAVIVFVGILFLGLIYAWKNDILKWE